jgi:hypothetical protein
LIAYSIKDRQKLIKAGIILLIMLIASFAYEFSFLVKHGLLLQSLGIAQSKHLIGFISDLGGISGFGIFTVLLMFFGGYVLWKLKKQPLGYIFLIAAIAFSISFSSSLNMYLVFPFAILAGYGFYAIIRMRWTLNLIKQLAVIVLIAGILFSTISYFNNTAKMNPTNEIVGGLLWLKNNSAPEDRVLSHYSRGIWIESIAERPVLLDSLFRITPEFYWKQNISDTIFYSRTLKNTTSLLNQYNISYIWIDSEMRNNLVWQREEEGLLFLFRNNETFKKVYEENGTEVWKVISQ